jgi:mono/diheme cytochrome c family protein
VIYDATCASCHGVTGKGDGAAAVGLDPRPSDFTDAFHARFYSDAARVEIIRKGLPGTGMGAFGGQYSDPEILDMYAYVKTLTPQTAEPPAGKHDDPSTHAH